MHQRLKIALAITAPDKPGSLLVCLDNEGIATLTDGCLDLRIGPCREIICLISSPSSSETWLEKKSQLVSKIVVIFTSFGTWNENAHFKIENKSPPPLSFTYPEKACRHDSIVFTVSWGSCALLGSSFSGITPVKWGQRRLRKSTTATANSSWCSRSLSLSHLSNLRYSRRDANAARSMTKANDEPFNNMERA